MRFSRRFFINLSIVGYLGIIFLAGAPEARSVPSRFNQGASAAAYALGIWPSWTIDGPPDVEGSKTYIEVDLGDGEIQEIDIGKPWEGRLAPYRKARWMRYAQKSLQDPSQKMLLKPALRHYFWMHESKSRAIKAIAIKRKWKGSKAGPFISEVILSQQASFEP